MGIDKLFQIWYCHPSYSWYIVPVEVVDLYISKACRREISGFYDRYFPLTQ